MLRHVSAVTVVIFRELSLVYAAYVSTCMLEVPHMILVIVMVTKCYSYCYGDEMLQLLLW